MGFTSVKQLQTVSDGVKSVAEAAMEAGGGLLCLNLPGFPVPSFSRAGA